MFDERPESDGTDILLGGESITSAVTLGMAQASPVSASQAAFTVDEAGLPVSNFFFWNPIAEMERLVNEKIHEARAFVNGILNNAQNQLQVFMTASFNPLYQTINRHEDDLDATMADVWAEYGDVIAVDAGGAGGIISGLETSVAALLSDTRNDLDGLIREANSALQSLFAQVNRYLDDFEDDANALIGSIFNFDLSGFLNGLNSLFSSAFTNPINGLLEWLVNSLEGLAQQGQQLVGSLLELGNQIISSGLEVLGDIFTGEPLEVTGPGLVLDEPFEFISEFVIIPALTATEGVSDPDEAASSAIEAIAAKLIEEAQNSVFGLVNQITQGWDPISMAGLQEIAKNAFSEIATQVYDFLMVEGLNFISPFVTDLHYGFVDDFLGPVIEDFLNPFLSFLEPIANILNPYLELINPHFQIPTPLDLDQIFSSVVSDDELVPHERIDLNSWTDEEFIEVADVAAATQIGFADLGVLQSISQTTGESLYEESDEANDHYKNVNDEFVYANVDWNPAIIDWARDRYDIIQVREAVVTLEEGVESFTYPYRSNVALMENKVTGEYFISIGGTDNDQGIEDVLSDIALLAVGSTAGSQHEIAKIIDDFFQLIPDDAYVNLTGGSLGGGEVMLQYRQNPDLFDHAYPVIAIGYGGFLGTYYAREYWSQDMMGDPNITEINGDDPGIDFNDWVTGTGHIDAGKTYYLPEVITDPNLPDDARERGEFWDVHSPYNLWYTMAQAAPHIFDFDPLVRTISDNEGLFPWSEYTDTFDENGIIQHRSIIFDDGRTRERDYVDGRPVLDIMEDVNDVYPWMSKSKTWSDGELTSRTIVFDDGRTRKTDLVDGQPVLRVMEDNNDLFAWTLVSDTLSEGDLISRTVVFDDGRTRETDYVDGQPVLNVMQDVHDAFPWLVISSTFSSGELTSRTVEYDNGVQNTTNFDNGLIDTIQRLDTADAFGWREINYTYVDGEVSSKEVVFDNGRTKVTTYELVANEGAMLSQAQAPGPVAFEEEATIDLIAEELDLIGIQENTDASIYG